jgi:NADH:ubiquinone oxidoreductase subunit F (NADH-binding)/NADH:ubiquinone oxidoreductase subunit E
MSGDATADGLPTNVLVRLSELQERLGWLSDDALKGLSKEANVPLYALQAVASFYPHYRRTPPPRCSVAVCRDSACHVRGGARLLEETRTRLRGDAAVEVAAVSCLGRCDAAPAAAVDEVPVPHATASVLADAATGRRPKPVEAPPTRPRRWETDPYADGAPRYGVLRRLLAEGGGAFDALPDALGRAGLQGMGGAGFPTGRKWDLVRRASGSPKYVVCNADESEPGTFKDRVILDELPHLVLEGMLLACRVIGAKDAVLYVRHEYRRERESFRRALEAATRDGVLAAAGVERLTVFTSPGGYILGEETALLEALEGKRGEPRNKPPFPGTHGLFGKPTLMNNVETFAHVPRILADGPERWKARGLGGAAGLKFLALSGDVANPGVYEVPAGTTVRALVEGPGGGVAGGKRMLAFSPGGASTAFLPASKADAPLSWEGMRAAGSALGSGAVFVLAEGRDLLDVATNVVRFFRNESCGKCVPCRVGSEKAVSILDRALAGGAETGDREALASLDEALAQTSICGLGMVALVPAVSVLDGFPDEPTARLARKAPKGS